MDAAEKGEVIEFCCVHYSEEASFAHGSSGGGGDQTAEQW